MLRLEQLSCGYGDMRAVHRLDLRVPAGGLTALLGANGAGKSSTILCIAGLVAIHGGRIRYRDTDISAHTPMRRVQNGIALVPEGRRLFPRLSVKENLIVGGYVRSPEMTRPGIDQVLTLFPRLSGRLGQLAGSLSGGEQQMLAIGRALMSRPQLLLVDELSLGLMPKIIDVCYEALLALKRAGLTIVLVEQNTRRALAVADEVCVLESGRTVWQGAARDARDDPKIVDALLGLGV